MRNLTWPQAQFLLINGRKVRRALWHRWLVQTSKHVLYFSLCPEVDPAVDPEGNYHVVEPAEHKLHDWFADDYTDEDWDLTVPIPPPIGLPSIPPPFGSGTGGSGAPGPGTPGTPAIGGGGTVGDGSGTISGGGGGDSSASYPGRLPHPETPPDPADPVVVTLAIQWRPDPDTSHPVYYRTPGPPTGSIVPPAGHFPTLPDDVIGETIVCWTDLGYPATATLYGTVTVAGGRAGTANGSIRNVDGSIFLFTMGVPGTQAFETTAQPYGTRSYIARVGMPGEHVLDPPIDVLSDWNVAPAAPRCSDIGW